MVMLVVISPAGCSAPFSSIIEMRPDSSRATFATICLVRFDDSAAESHVSVTYIISTTTFPHRRDPRVLHLSILIGKDMVKS